MNESSKESDKDWFVLAGFKTIYWTRLVEENNHEAKGFSAKTSHIIFTKK